MKNWDVELYIRYLTLLCINGQKKKIIKVLERNICDSLDECLKIVTKYKIKSAISMLEYQQGNVEIALQIRFDVFLCS